MGGYTGLHQEMARQRQADVLAGAEHVRFVRLARAETPRHREWPGGRLDRIVIRRGHERWQEWQEGFCRLVEAIGRSGFHADHDAQVSAWVVEQQKLHRLSILGRKRTRLLEALPGWTWEGATIGAVARLSEPNDLRLAAWASDLVQHLRVDTDFRQTGLVLAVS